MRFKLEIVMLTPEFTEQEVEEEFDGKLTDEKLAAATEELREDFCESFGGDGSRLETFKLTRVEEPPAV